MGDDIRVKILEMVYKQCLKLLNPTSRQFGEEFPNADPLTFNPYPLSEDEVMALGTPIIEYVQFDTFTLADANNLDKDGLVPCLFILEGTDSFTDIDQNDNDVKNTVRDSMSILLRVLLKQESIFNVSFDNSITLKSARLRSQLDYFMDTNYFEGVTANRFGYELPSHVWRSIIQSSYNLEGEASPYEVVDFRLLVTYNKQAQRVK